VVAIAVQSSLLSQLRRENESLRAGSHDLEQLRQDSREDHSVNQQLDQFRADSAELQRLQSEVAQLRKQLQELASLRAENQRLVAEKASAERRALPQAQTEEDPFAASKNRAQRINCISNLKQIGLAARLWAKDYNDVLPTDFLTMSNELNSPRILVCPGDTNRPLALNWSEFSPANISYQLLSPGASEHEPAVVYVRCPIHNNVGLVDGSAQMLEPNVKLSQRDGKWVLMQSPSERN
jgi:Skp family chaperone for outer membrane proteins